MAITKDIRPRCTFMRDWMGQCDKPSINSTTHAALGVPLRCAEHINLKCSSCGKQADKTCDQTMGSFVCGAELCSECKHGDPARMSHVPTTRAAVEARQTAARLVRGPVEGVTVYPARDIGPSAELQRKVEAARRMEATASTTPPSVQAGTVRGVRMARTARKSRKHG